MVIYCKVMYTDPGTPEKVQSLNMAASESNRVSLVAQLTSLVAQTVKRLSIMLETQVQSLGWEDPLEKGMTTHSSILAPSPKKRAQRNMEKEMTTHSSILAWKIPWTEEPVGLQSMGSQRVRHD